MSRPPRSHRRDDARTSSDSTSQQLEHQVNHMHHRELWLESEQCATTRTSIEKALLSVRRYDGDHEKGAAIIRDDHIQEFPHRKIYVFQGRTPAESSRHAHSVAVESEKPPQCAISNTTGSRRGVWPNSPLKTANPTLLIGYDIRSRCVRRNGLESEQGVSRETTYNTCEPVGLKLQPCMYVSKRTCVPLCSCVPVCVCRPCDSPT
jgi:hypothetical protein